MGIKKIINKMFYPHTYSSAAYVTYLIKCGVKIGKGTWFVKPKNTTIDTQKGIFLEIGENCCITSGVVILAHDWSYSVVAQVYNEAYEKQQITHIGNNVFIGNNAIILMGAQVGDNIIIGAGAVVSGKIESNSVYAGNPAKKICSLNEQYKKLKEGYEKSALQYIERFQQINGHTPNYLEMGGYASLFIEKNENNMQYYFGHSAIPNAIKNMPPKYDSVEEFIKHMKYTERCQCDYSKS